MMRTVKRWLLRMLFGALSDRVIREALAQSSEFVWDEENQKALEIFLAGSTGAKLMVHLNSSLAGMLLSASSEYNRDSAIHKLAQAKGFSLAIGLIRLSCPTPYLQKEDIPAEEKEKEKDNPFRDPFMPVESSPTIF